MLFYCFGVCRVTEAAVVTLRAGTVADEAAAEVAAAVVAMGSMGDIRERC